MNSESPAKVEKPKNKSTNLRMGPSLVGTMTIGLFLVDFYRHGNLPQALADSAGMAVGSTFGVLIVAFFTRSRNSK